MSNWFSHSFELHLKANFQSTSGGYGEYIYRVSKNECAGTDTVFLPISKVSSGTVSLRKLRFLFRLIFLIDDIIKNMKFSYVLEEMDHLTGSSKKIILFNLKRLNILCLRQLLELIFEIFFWHLHQNNCQNKRTAHLTSCRATPTLPEGDLYPHK